MESASRDDIRKLLKMFGIRADELIVAPLAPHPSAGAAASGIDPGGPDRLRKGPARRSAALGTRGRRAEGVIGSRPTKSALGLSLRAAASRRRGNRLTEEIATAS